jgi:hypothetical protein
VKKHSGAGRQRAAWGLVGAIVLVASGCGNSDGPGDTTPGDTEKGLIDPTATEIDCTPFAGSTPAQACGGFARARCANDMTCTAMSLGVNAEGCVERVQELCQRELALPGTGYSAAYISAQADLLSYAGCEAQKHINDAVFSCFSGHGSLPPESACVSDAQCDSGACAFADGESCGKCRKVLGTSCTATCGGSGLYQCVNGTCQPRRVAGEACVNDYDCASPLTCVAKLCAAPLPIGSACTLDATAFDPTEGDGGCGLSGHCTATCTTDATGAHTCAPGTCVPRARSGEPCTPGQVVSGCLDWLTCLSSGVCGVPATTAGVACGDRDDCDLDGAGYRCSGGPGTPGVCTAPKVAQKGEPCQSNTVTIYCATGLGCAADGTCALLAAKGAACTQNGDCGPGLVCLNATCQDPLALSCH